MTARAFSREGRRLLALFDLDGTLLTGPSSERRFGAWLFRRRAIGWRQGLAWTSYLVRFAHRDRGDVLRRNKGYVAGLPSGELAALARAHVDEVLLAGGVIDQQAAAALERHRRAGDRIALLSGTLQPLADAYARSLGIEFAIGSLAPSRGTRHVVGPPERHPYGPAKRALAERTRIALDIERADTVAYGNSHADRFLLESAGVAVAVEPDRALARLATARGWAILRHRRDVER